MREKERRQESKRECYHESLEVCRKEVMDSEKWEAGGGHDDLHGEEIVA